jgi:hypothetical protein
MRPNLTFFKNKLNSFLKRRPRAALKLIFFLKAKSFEMDFAMNTNCFQERHTLCDAHRCLNQKKRA